MKTVYHIPIATPIMILLPNNNWKQENMKHKESSRNNYFTDDDEIFTPETTKLSMAILGGSARGYMNRLIRGGYYAFHDDGTRCTIIVLGKLLKTV